MITLQQPSLPSIEGAAKLSSFDQFMLFIQFLADPKLVQDHIAQVFKARIEAADFLLEAKNERATLDQARIEHGQALKKERGEHESSLAEQKTKFSAECAAAMDEIRRARASAEKLAAKAETDAATAAEMRADLDRRLALIKQAGG